MWNVGKQTKEGAGRPLRCLADPAPGPPARRGAFLAPGNAGRSPGDLSGGDQCRSPARPSSPPPKRTAKRTGIGGKIGAETGGPILPNLPTPAPPRPVRWALRRAGRSAPRLHRRASASTPAGRWRGILRHVATAPFPVIATKWAAWARGVSKSREATAHRPDVAVSVQRREMDRGRGG